MALNPPQAIAVLNEYIRKKNPARFNLIERIHEQIMTNMPTSNSPDCEDMAETSLLTKWLENDLHLVAMQTLLDKSNYPDDTFGIVLRSMMQHHVWHNLHIVYICIILLNARVMRCKALQQYRPAEDYVQEQQFGAMSSLDSLLIPLGSLWPMIWKACFDESSGRLPSLKPGYDFRMIMLLAREYCWVLYERHPEPPLWGENTSHLLDLLLLGIIMAENDPWYIEGAFGAFSVMLRGYKILDTVTQYLRNSWVGEKHAMLLTKVFMSQILSRKERENPSSPFIFLEALLQIYPVIVTSEYNGLSLVETVAYGWKNDLCLHGFTDSATRACIELLASIVGEPGGFYDLEAKIDDDFSRLVGHKDLCILSLIGSTLVHQIEDEDDSIDDCAASFVTLLQKFTVRIDVMSRTDPSGWNHFLTALAQATSPVSGPFVEALDVLEAYNTWRDNTCDNTWREVEEDTVMCDILVESLQKLLALLKPHEPSETQQRRFSTPPRHIRGWWKHTSCFWHKCLCHDDAAPIHPMKICKGCGLAAYCSTFCQRSDWREGDHRDFCKKHPLK